MAPRVKLNQEHLVYLQECYEKIKTEKRKLTTDLVLDFNKKYPDLKVSYYILNNCLKNKTIDNSTLPVFLFFIYRSFSTLNSFNLNYLGQYFRSNK